MRLLIVILVVLMLAAPVVCGAFEDKTAIPEPVVKQRAERVVIRGENGQPVLSFILVYDDEGSPARFLVVDRENQVFMSASQGGGR